MNDVQRPRTHLFLLRMWIEDLGDGKAEWRGKVQHVLSGEASYFRDWQALQQFIKAHTDFRIRSGQSINQEDVSPKT